jgi:hypothetical protein
MTSCVHCRRVFLRTAKLLVVLALTLSIGVHWIFLQSVAWVGMVVNYSQSASLSKALEMTFDGQHPCQLCNLVRQGKASEKKQESQKPVTKLDCWLVNEQPAFIVPLSHQTVSSCALFLLPRTESPPTPPPRSA